MSEKEKKSPEHESEEHIYYPLEARLNKLVTPFQEFVRKETASGIMLMLAACAALLIMNSPWHEFYDAFIHIPIDISFGHYPLDFSLLHWVNEGLMVFFFFVVGLEIKREILVGELSDMRKAALPVIAAVGGMVLPALLYMLVIPSGEFAHGWGIPMATDIAFCIAALVVLGKRVPEGLMIFLVTLAIADDIGAVLVIALFYTKTLHWGALGAAVALSFFLLVLNKTGVRRGLPYLVTGCLLWLMLLKSGVHATLAGIIVAFSAPTQAHYNQVRFINGMQKLLERFKELHNPHKIILGNREQIDILHTMKMQIYRAESPLQRFLEYLHLPVAMLIVPLFAFVNTGIPLNAEILKESITHPVTMAVLIGLVVGKPLGISIFSYIAVKSGVASVPRGVRAVHIFGAGMLGGIGFTMSIFISELCFGADAETLRLAKTGILLASVLAGILGYLLLRLSSGSDRPEEKAATQN